LRQEIDSLKARQQAVEDLQSDRNLPVHLLDELVKQVPEGVYLQSLAQDNLRVSMTGLAQSNERVSELLRNIGNNSAWLSKPELVEIKSVPVGRDNQRLNQFTITAISNRPRERNAALSNSAQKPRLQPPAWVSNWCAMVDINKYLDQFKNLNRDVGAWPVLPRAAAIIALVLVVLTLGWFFYWSDQVDELGRGQAEEERLKEVYKAKLQLAINIEPLRRQRELVAQYVFRLESSFRARPKWTPCCRTSIRPE